MAKFNVGDKVVCIDASQQYGDLVLNGKYTVKFVSDKYVELQEVEYEWDANRFSLVEKAIDTSTQPTYNGYSLHELLDRISLCQQIIEDHVSNHHLGHLVTKEIMLAQGHLYKAYNKIGEIHLTKD